MTRACDGCTLCCKLIPVEEIDKPRTTWCSHTAQDKHSCSIYASRPISCVMWSCRWLTDDTIPYDLKPDKVGFVIDPVLEDVQLTNPDTNESIIVKAVQVWVDAGHEDFWRLPKYRTMVLHWMAQGHLCIIRTKTPTDGRCLMPDGQGGITLQRHTIDYDMVSAKIKATIERIRRTSTAPKHVPPTEEAHD